MSRILWDAVPAHVKSALQARERAPREGETAIVDAARGERWYFRRTQYGWLHLSTDRQSSNDALASDLTPEQRAEALRQVEKVEKAMERSLARDERLASSSVGNRTMQGLAAEELARALADQVVKQAVRNVVTKIMLDLRGDPGVRWSLTIKERTTLELTLTDQFLVSVGIGGIAVRGDELWTVLLPGAEFRGWLRRISQSPACRHTELTLVGDVDRVP